MSLWSDFQEYAEMTQGGIYEYEETADAAWAMLMFLGLDPQAETSAIQEIKPIDLVELADEMFGDDDEQEEY